MGKIIASELIFGRNEGVLNLQDTLSVNMIVSLDKAGNIVSNSDIMNANKLLTIIKRACSEIHTNISYDFRRLTSEIQKINRAGSISASALALREAACIAHYPQFGFLPCLIFDHRDKEATASDFRKNHKTFELIEPNMGCVICGNQDDGEFQITIIAIDPFNPETAPISSTISVNNISSSDVSDFIAIDHEILPKVIFTNMLKSIGKWTGSTIVETLQFSDVPVAGSTLINGWGFEIHTLSARYVVGSVTFTEKIYSPCVFGLCAYRTETAFAVRSTGIPYRGYMRAITGTACLSPSTPSGGILPAKLTGRCDFEIELGVDGEEVRETVSDPFIAGLTDGMIRYVINNGLETEFTIDTPSIATPGGTFDDWDVTATISNDDFINFAVPGCTLSVVDRTADTLTLRLVLPEDMLAVIPEYTITRITITISNGFVSRPISLVVLFNIGYLAETDGILPFGTALQYNGVDGATVRAAPAGTTIGIITVPQLVSLFEIKQPDGFSWDRGFVVLPSGRVVVSDPEKLAENNYEIRARLIGLTQRFELPFYNHSRLLNLQFAE